jgi:hypothetical protein
MYNKLAKEVELKFSESYPMQIVYVLAKDATTEQNEESGTKNARLLFYLAPKIAD